MGTKTSLLYLILLLGTGAPTAVSASEHLTETRYCGEPERYADGKIKRDKSVVRAFEKQYPLPSRYRRDDWQVDHVIPLAQCGCDVVWNMQWLPKAIKTCTSNDCKDRWEREGIYPRRCTQ